jgi:hypothetical protein
MFMSIGTLRGEVKDPCPPADIAGMTPLSPEDALHQLLAPGEAELEISSGAYVRVRTESVDGRRADATAPRLSVASGMQLTGRVIAEDGTPWALTLVIDSATYHSPDLALIALRVMQVQVDASRRAAQRVPIGGVAWLVAVNCRDIVDGDRVEGSLEDLSKSGVAFSTRRVLRIGDRLMFHGRFFADEINGEVRVASLRQAAAPGHMIVGCRFLNLDAESESRIDRILSGGRSEPARPSTTLDLGSLRQAAQSHDEDPPDGGSGSWKSRFRR